MADPKQYYPDHDWEKIKAEERLFRHLPKMPLGDDFVNLTRRFRDELDYDLMFLTAIPHYNDVPWAFYDKMLWCQERYPDIPVHFGPYSEDKCRRAAPGNILVDDRPDNCAQWQTCGGIAVNVPVGQEYLGLQELQLIFDNKHSLMNIRALDQKL